MFPRADLITLNRTFLDHSPIVDKFSEEVQTFSSFKFQHMWCHYVDFPTVVAYSWAGIIEGEPMRVFVEKLKRLKKDLCEWNRSSFGKVQSKVQIAEVN
jgi:hypothetical protein